MGLFSVAPNQRVHARKFPKMPGPRPDHAEARRAEALERAKERAGRTAKQQLAHLDDVLGRGVGAARERARLTAQIAAPPPPPPASKSKR